MLFCKGRSSYNCGEKFFLSYLFDFSMLFHVKGIGKVGELMFICYNRDNKVKHCGDG